MRIETGIAHKVLTSMSDSIVIQRITWRCNNLRTRVNTTSNNELLVTPARVVIVFCSANSEISEHVCCRVVFAYNCT